MALYASDESYASQSRLRLTRQETDQLNLMRFSVTNPRWKKNASA